MHIEGHEAPKRPSKDVWAMIQARHFLKNVEEFEHEPEIKQVMKRLACGCGDSEGALGVLLEILQLFKPRPQESGKTVYRLEQPLDSDFAWRQGESVLTLLLYWLDEFNLCQHGHNILKDNTLTDLGVKVRERLEQAEAPRR